MAGAVGGRGARAFAVLAVLLGLLGMHGLASAHHAAASPVADRAAASVSERPATERPATAQPATQPAHQPQTVARHGAGPGAGALAGLDGPSCRDECPTAVGLCVAVLAGAALALLLARERPAVPLPALARTSLRGPAPPVRQARGPDPVRELCVSRT